MGLEALLRAGRRPAVLSWMERTRAVALLTVEPPAPEAVRDELAELRAVHLELAQALRETGAEPAGLRARQAAAEARIRRATWRRTAVTAVRKTPARSARSRRLRRLLDGSVLVSYGIAAGPAVRGGGAAAVHPAGAASARWRRCSSSGTRCCSRCAGWPGRGRTAATMRAGAEHALRRLTELLIEPLGVPADVPLVVVPSSRTEPAALVGAAPRRRCCVAPSAALWARTRETEPAGPAEVVLVAGPRLDGAVAEVAAVARAATGR